MAEINYPSTQAQSAVSRRQDTLWAYCRSGERIAIIFFAYLALLGVAFHFPRTHLAACAAIPLVIGAASFVETRLGNRWSSYVRDWLTSALILVAYWEIDLFATGRFQTDWQGNWLGFDQWLLNEVGLKRAIESLGPVIPTLLEGCYLFLYAIPPFCLAMLYVYRRIGNVDRFYQAFFPGALGAYALLPLIPIQSPRHFAPGEDLPAYTSAFRAFNVYVLDHLDIATSVFPSGHVAVAFASYYAIRRALPGAVWVHRTVLGVAVCVFLATIYGRYHYAADGLMSILITSLAFRVLEVLDRRG